MNKTFYKINNLELSLNISASYIIPRRRRIMCELILHMKDSTERTIEERRKKKNAGKRASEDR